MKITRAEIFVRTTPPNRSSFQIGGGSGAKPVKRRPRGILLARIELMDGHGRKTWGAAGDRPSFGWLDKREGDEFSSERKLERLLQLVKQAGAVYTEDEFRDPFTQWLRCHGEVHRLGKTADHESLSASYASAIWERALVDAVCRLQGVSVFDAVKEGRLGFDARQADNKLLGKLPLPRTPRTIFAIRHTVGLADPLIAADLDEGQRVDDGEPETLEEYVRRDGLRHFKVKISGNLEADLERLARVWAVVASAETPVVTLDGNESYRDVEAFERFVRSLEESQLGLFQHIAFIEQPLTRRLTLDRSTSRTIQRIARRKPLVIDEADGSLDAFSQAAEIGYTGVSHKNCKGFFKSLINAVRCRQWSDGNGAAALFQTGEDLSNMPLAPLHQDYAALSILNIAHVERNGHHYGYGLSHLSPREKRQVAQHHRDMYVKRREEWFLDIRGGLVDTGSLQ